MKKVYLILFVLGIFLNSCFPLGEMKAVGSSIFSNFYIGMSHKKFRVYTQYIQGQEEDIEISNGKKFKLYLFEFEHNTGRVKRPVDLQVVVFYKKKLYYSGTIDKYKSHDSSDLREIGNIAGQLYLDNL